MATLCAETNAVLKLDLGGTGGIRRIALAKLWDPTTSRVSYTRLTSMALLYSNLPTPNIHSVSITYTDEDGDSITISTDDELADAFEQFANSDPPVVRARACFNVRRGKGKIVEDLKQAVSEIGETAKGSGGKLEGALESFVCILTQAVDSLSKNVEVLKQKKKGNNNKGVGAVPKEVRAKNHRAHMCSSSKSREVNAKPPQKEEVAASLAPTEEHTNILTVSTPLDKEFIHGRHTCDKCLVTPIIGIRYHALNLPDHDLCATCVLEQKGSDILFEPTELERDRYLQSKWKRRQWRQKRSPTGRNCRRDMAQCTVDSALKEAIRRSLQDIKPKTDEPKETTTTVVEEEAGTIDQSRGLSDGDVLDTFAINPNCVEEAVVENSGGGEEEVATTEEDVLSVVGDETDSCIDDLKLFNEKDSNEETDETFFMEEVSETTKTEIAEEINETESYAQLQAELEAEIAVDVTPTIDTTTTPIIPEAEKSHETSFTEDAEGQGDVAIAIGRALDVTADAIDAVVSEVQHNSSLDSQTKTGCTIIESVQSTDSRNEASSEGISYTNDSNDESGVSIQSEPSVDSNDSWQVLDDEGQVTSDEMIAQAAQLLGSALFQSDIISEVTDHKDEYTVATAAAGQSTTSTPSYADSVPTEVRSIGSIATVVLSRWDSELKQMHELGFLDDTKNVDALEHLEAAKMGVDSEDAVTVNEAVNYLLSEYRQQV